jgi:5-methylcytosine-specific restriction endonuclease McrA
MYAFQCLICGESASGGWLSHSRIPRHLPIPEWDETLSKKYYEERRQQQLALRETERADWFHEHEQYLLSPQWRVLRRKVLERAGGLCEGCREKPATQVHHLTYAHWQHELLFELVAICDDCHQRIHPHMETPTWATPAG